MIESISEPVKHALKESLHERIQSSLQMKVVGHVRLPDSFFKRASDESELYKSLLVPVVKMNDRLEVTYCNKAASLVFGVGLLENNILGHDRQSIRRLLVGGFAKFMLWFKSEDATPFELRLKVIGYAKKFVAYKLHASVGNHEYCFLFLPVSNIRSLNEDHDIYKMAYENSMNAIYITDSSNRIVAANPRCVNLFGYSYEEMLGKTDDKLYTEDSRKKLAEMKEEINRETNFLVRSLECYSRSKGETFDKKYLETNILAVDNDGSSDKKLIHFVQNITDQVQLHNELKKAADYDAVTGLNNRTAFVREFSTVFKEAQRHGEKLCVFYVDLDHFKFINDHYGHNYGDMLLKYMGQRIEGCFKKSDLVARLGGDEFAVLLLGDFQKPTLSMLAMKLIECLARPYQLEDITHTCTCSVGIACYPDDALDQNALLRAADSAMYNAKRKGRNILSFYDADHQKMASDRGVARNRLDSALSDGRVKLFYQPIHNIRTGEVTGFEGLARCFDESGNMSLPPTFLPVIEQTPLMSSWGLESARQAWMQATFFSKQRIKIPISVNFSAYQLCSEQLVEFLINQAKKSPQVVPFLKIEITEVLMFEENSTVIENINRLMQHGYLFLLDDFGTGHASIYSLKQFEFDSIKIDKSFVDEIMVPTGPKGLLLDAIVSIIETLNIAVVCEGIENQKQVDHLLGLECTMGQGFYYAEAMNKSEMSAYIRRFNPRPPS